MLDLLVEEETKVIETDLSLEKKDVDLELGLVVGRSEGKGLDLVKDHQGDVIGLEIVTGLEIGQGTDRDLENETGRSLENVIDQETDRGIVTDPRIRIDQDLIQ